MVKLIEDGCVCVCNVSLFCEWNLSLHDMVV